MSVFDFGSRNLLKERGYSGLACERIKRPEHLKERDQAAFGRLLGLNRAPEVKTLRRGLTGG
jgi:hypothetical protein